MDEIGVAVLSSFLAVAFDTMATPKYKTFFKRRKFSYKRIKELEEEMIALSSMVDDAEEKQFTKKKVRQWLLNLKDATHEAEDLLDGIRIEYQAYQLKAVKEDKEDQERSSTSQDPPKQKLEPELQEILQKLKDLTKKLKDLTKKGDSLRLRKRETTSSSASDLEYDVFLNFRGEDVRYGFLDNLKDALRRERVKRFYDAEDLRKGDDDIWTIFEKIKVSKMSIMVFSKDYASSWFCLKELVKILECKETWGHKALPVFYHVDPQDVANQSGTYAEAFRRHEEKGTYSEEMPTWRTSLREAAAIVGLHLVNTRPEKDDIQDIVDAVKKMLEFDKEKTSQDEGEP